MKLTELPAHLAQDWPGSLWLVSNYTTIVQFPFQPAYLPTALVPATADMIDMTQPWANPHFGATHLLFSDLHLPPLYKMSKDRAIAVKAEKGWDLGLWPSFPTVSPPSMEEMVVQLPEAYLIALEERASNRPIR